MSLNIVIPTYKRPERVISKALVTDPILCVAESEEGVYREHNPECEIVTHPDSVKGLPAKRNWMVQRFGDFREPKTLRKWQRFTFGRPTNSFPDGVTQKARFTSKSRFARIGTRPTK